MSLALISQSAAFEMQKLCEILIELYIDANSSPNRVGEGGGKDGVERHRLMTNTVQGQQ